MKLPTVYTQKMNSLSMKLAVCYWAQGCCKFRRQNTQQTLV